MIAACEFRAQDQSTDFVIPSLYEKKLRRRLALLRPLKEREAWCLAWLGGLAHECSHPFSKVLIDEGSVPVAFPCDVASSKTLKELMNRGLVRRESGLDADVIYSLTLAGFDALREQCERGHLVKLGQLKRDGPSYEEGNRSDK